MAKDTEADERFSWGVGDLVFDPADEDQPTVEAATKADDNTTCDCVHDKPNA